MDPGERPSAAEVVEALIRQMSVARPKAAALSLQVSLAFYNMHLRALYFAFAFTASMVSRHDVDESWSRELES